jgi:hypothetical protein
VVRVVIQAQVVIVGIILVLQGTLGLVVSVEKVVIVGIVVILGYLGIADR